MSQLLSDDIRFALARADKWLYEQGRIALSQIHNQSSDAVLRSIKARTEILFWWTYVSPDLNSKSNLALIREIGDRDIGILLSIFRHNPEISSLFFALFSSIWDNLTDAEKADADLLSDYLLSFPSERTLFRTLDHCHSTSIFLNKKWPTELARFLLGNSCLPLSGNIIYCTEEILYAVTHTIFYASDFGKNTELLSEYPEAPLTEFLHHLSRNAILSSDADILSEIILCLMFIGEENSSYKEFLPYLIESQAEQGFWTANKSVIDAVEADGLPKECIPFFAHYHTTMLARDVLARYNSKIHNLRHPTVRPKRLARPPKSSNGGIGPEITKEMRALVNADERVRNLVRLINSAQKGEYCSYAKADSVDALLRKMSENDVVGVALTLSNDRPPASIQKAVKFFHRTNKSCVLGYGFPNPNGKNYETDSIVMAMAGTLIDKKISGWDEY